MPSFDWATIWAVFAETLAQLCPSIREIALPFKLYYSGHTDGSRLHFGDGIEALDPVFERDALANLERVLFLLYIILPYKGDAAPVAPITKEQVEEAIQTKLPKLHKRGTSRVEYRYIPYRLRDHVSTGSSGSSRHSSTSST